MNTLEHLDTAQEISTLYNNWLAKNFNESNNTNPFQPSLEDDMDIIHDFDSYDYLEESFDYLEESFEYNNGFDDSMFNEAPNLELHSDNEEEEFEYNN